MAMSLHDILLIEVADSDVPKSRRLQNTSAKSNSETRNYYTNDELSKREAIHKWFNSFSHENKFYIDTNKTLQYIELFEKTVLPFNSVFLNKLEGFETAIANFRVYKAQESIKIPNLFSSGEDNRYLKFDNNDKTIKVFRDLICGRISKVVISKKNVHDFYVWLELDPKYKKHLSDNGVNFDSTEKEEKSIVTGGYNRIYYGVPGSGKSYVVKKLYDKPDSKVFRTTFYPDYSNSDFIGQILPKVNENGEVFYEFNPGVFSQSLRYAYANPSEKTILIIEEINRGNASAIFGDVFQLLDRDPRGESLYSINMNNLEDWLNANKILVSRIFIPSNLYIIATMNTSDQNVFTLDTAFKRRWSFEHVPNKFDNIIHIDWFDWFIPGSNYTWKEFVNIINSHLINNNHFSINSEDKQLGVFYVQDNVLCQTPNDNDVDKKLEFANKVLMYIWEDIAKISIEDWFLENIRSYEELLEIFLDSSLEVFANLFPDKIL